MTKENYLTEKDLAKRWGFSVRTMQKRRWSNEGPSYIRIYGRIRYSLEAVENFEKKNSHLSSMYRKRPSTLLMEVANA
jgi:hypothetical protein